MPTEDFERNLAEGAVKAAQQFSELTPDGDVFTNDVAAAFVPENEEIVLFINTGRTDLTTGSILKMKVTVLDPGSAEHGLSYLHSMALGEAAQMKAMLDLWKSMVVSPKEIVDEDFFYGTNKNGNNPQLRRPSSAFRSSLTFKLLSILGIDGDFFEDLGRMVPTTTRRQVTKSSIQLQKLGDSLQAKSSSGSQTSSFGKLGSISTGSQ